MASKHTSLQPPVARAHAFTLVELLVVIGIIALLVGMLLPALASVREQSNSVKCLAILRQFVMAEQVYANESRGWAVPGVMGATLAVGGPGRQDWTNNNGFRKVLAAKEWSVVPNGYATRVNTGLVCPNAQWAIEYATNNNGTDISYSYGYNMRDLGYDAIHVINNNPGDAGKWNSYTDFASIRYTKIRRPADKIAFADAPNLFIRPYQSDHVGKVAGHIDGPPGDLFHVAYRHGRKKNLINVAFFDGHATTLQRSEVTAVVNAAIAAPNGNPANRTANWDLRWNLATN